MSLWLDDQTVERCRGLPGDDKVDIRRAYNCLDRINTAEI
jgi:hypothetical protein